MSLAIASMTAGGHFVSITPRSFCNGPYFKSFRKTFLGTMQLNRLHLFDSRKDAFSDDAVLQENIIVSATRNESKSRERVAISSSSGPSDAESVSRNVPYESVVSATDPDLFIHLAMDEDADAISKRVGCLPATLPDTGASISTGRVVDFRVREFLRDGMEANTVPLIYPCNISQSGINWPKDKTKKPQAIIDCDATAKQMVDSGVFVLVKRFTTKEEARRVVATVFDCEAIGCGRVGFENHLNFFHSEGGSLGTNVANGLAAYLNTSTVDLFFRQFNGHTQVNASDLKKLKYPSREQLIEIGKRMARRKVVDESTTDEIVGEIVGWS
jgi:adenine-specific DNA-methyltransferase